VIGNTGATFLFACLMFNFVNILINVGEERQLRLRTALNLMGLMVRCSQVVTCRLKASADRQTDQDSVYWASWMVTYVFHMTWSTFLLVAFGAAFQFDLFINNAFGTYFLVVWLFSLTLIPMAFWLSTTLKSTTSASESPLSAARLSLNHVVDIACVCVQWAWAS
jgi:hypothetical protein